MLRILTWCLVAAGMLSAQKFEEVSIKPGDPNTNGSSTNSNPGRFTATNVTLKRLIVRAYDIEPYQFEGGPKWIDSEKFTVVAKFEDDEVKTRSREERQKILRAALQAMLAERFQIATHRETKIMPAFALVVAKGGPKMKEVEAQGGSSWNQNNGVFTANRITMEGIASVLSGIVNRPVEDRTGLKASYELKLEWLPENAKTDTSTAASIYTALQEQLGLKLESIKAPIEMLVVDRAEKPTEN